MSRSSIAVATTSLRRASASVIETLELRRLLSAGTYDLADTITQTPAREDRADFGQSVATYGNLALVGIPATDTGSEPGVSFGKAQLIDTTNNQVLQTFTDPDELDADHFGFSVAFLADGKIAIAANAGGSGKVFIYNADDIDNYADNTPNAVIENTFGGSMGATLRAFGSDELLVSVIGSGPLGKGIIARYDSGGTLLNSYQNILTGTDDFFGFQMAVQGTTVYAYAVGLNGAGVYKLDTATSITTLFTEANGGDPSFGLALAATPSAVYIGSSGSIKAVYEYSNAASLLRTVNAPTGNPQYSDDFGAFGEGIAISDDALIVSGNHGFTYDEQTNEFAYGGQVFVLDLSTPAVDLVQIINDPTPQALDAPVTGNVDQFGSQVGVLANGNLIIADLNDDNGVEGALDMGAAYIFAPAVTNQPPTNAQINGQINGQATVVRQQPIAFTGSFTDPDGGDTVRWDFGDGNVIAAHPTTDPGALTVSHAYQTAGGFTVTMTIADAAANATISATFAVTVTSAFMQGGNLYLGGGAGADKYSITKASGGIKVNANGTTTFYPVTTGRVVIYGGDGNDSIQSNADVPVPFEIHGGAGKDTIKGGMKNDILVGDDDNDQINGNDGRDLVIGGTGADQVSSNHGDDILVAATTSYDDNSDALQAVQAEWGSARTYLQRINNIRDGSGSVDRNNGGYFLKADVTVFDDNLADTLTADGQTDWFFANTADGGVRDKTDVKVGEIIDDVDTVVL